MIDSAAKVIAVITVNFVPAGPHLSVIRPFQQTVWSDRQEELPLIFVPL